MATPRRLRTRPGRAYWSIGTAESISKANQERSPTPQTRISSDFWCDFRVVCFTVARREAAMASRKQLTWTELRVGIFVLVGLFVLAAGIFYVTGGGILGPKYRLKTYLPEVAGLSNGAPVRLDGVEFGNGESIRLLPRTPGKAPQKSKNIEVVMRVDKRYQDDILTDSTASLITEGLLGNRYVNI